MYKRQQQDVVTDQKVVMAYHYKPVDPAPWKALDAYRVYLSLIHIFPGKGGRHGRV